MSFCCMPKRMLVACCFSVSLFCSEGNGMDKWPSMALDGTSEHPEPQALVDYHKSRNRLGYRFFIPKNEGECKLVYSSYCKGEFPGWSAFTVNMGDELSLRLRIGDMFFIDKYIEHIETFVSLLASHSDRNFVGDLFGVFGLPNTLGEYGVRSAWSSACRDHVLSEAQALYVIFRLDDILNRTQLYPVNILMDAYFTRDLPTKVKKVTQAEVRKMYEEKGLSIPEKLK